MRPKPSVSVVIPAFNVAPFIDTAIASVLRQTYGDFEIIVVNDGSTDDTRDRVARIRDQRLRIVDQPNGGFSAARNTGIQAARSEYIAFLDGDDYWEPRLLESLVGYLNRHPEADVAHGHTRLVSEDGVDTGRIVGYAPGPVSVSRLIVRNVVNMSTVVSRRSALQRAGSLDPQFPASEDHDLWVRVALLREHNIHGVDDVLACYRMRNGQTTKDWRKMRTGGLMLLDKAGTLAPSVVQGIRREAEAHLNRYLGFIAYEAGDDRQARLFLAAAVHNVCGSLVRDRRFWLLVALVSSRFIVPHRLHHNLYLACRRMQMTIRAATSPAQRVNTPAASIDVVH